MITYGYSIQGKSHIQRGVVCQDSSKVQRLRANVYMGIVADGVGSAVHSDIGSKMAVDALFAFCNEHIKRGYSIEQMLQVLQQGYEYAFQQIEQYVSTNKQDIAQYDTTLSAVIYDGENIIYGHAGDGGIVMRCQTGEIKALTNRQKGADGVSVRPLRAGSTSWEFGVSQEAAAGVLLVTDGLLDGVIEPSLLNIPKTSTQFIQGNFKKNNVYITVAEFFMNPDVVFNNREIVDPERLMEHYLRGDLSGEDEGNFLQYMKASYTKSFGDKNAEKLCQVIAQYSYAVWALSKVDDDKSLVCLMNNAMKVEKQKLEYYVEPNWNWLAGCQKALLTNTTMPEKPQSNMAFDKNFESVQEKSSVSNTSRKKEHREPQKSNVNKRAASSDQRFQAAKERNSMERYSTKHRNAEKKGNKHISVLVCVGIVLLCIGMFALGNVIGRQNAKPRVVEAERKEPARTPVVSIAPTQEEIAQQNESMSYEVLCSIAKMEDDKNAFTEEHADAFWELTERCGIKATILEIGKIQEGQNDDPTDQQRDKAGKQSSDEALSSPLPSPSADNTREQQKISDSWDALKDVLERVSDSANYSEQILNNRYSNLPKTWKQSIKKNIVTLWKMRSDLHKTMA